mmetsp:Transcript_23111/g.48529  ORF Transcript_23111/g.48529 Transcript_23111/m.48529 type:complete len:493 (+) Transcript_23111:154-1632(+)
MHKKSATPHKQQRPSCSTPAGRRKGIAFEISSCSAVPRRQCSRFYGNLTLFIVCTIVPEGNSQARRAMQPFVFAAVGGSNTAGAGSIDGRARGHQSFGKLTFQALKARGEVVDFAEGGIGAMGPFFAAACTQRFFPPLTRFATIEYMPNMGWVGNDDGELSAIELMMHTLLNRTAKTVLVNILPGASKSKARYPDKCRLSFGQGCNSHLHVVQLHHRLMRLADEFNLPTITMDYEDPLHRPHFGYDMIHLNQSGHILVHQQLMTLYDTWPEWTPTQPRDATRAAKGMGVECRLGDEVSSIVGGVRGFSRVDFSRPGQREKIGWEATTPGAHISLCAELPAEAHAAVDDSLKAKRPTYILTLGLQQGDASHKPRFGVAHISCHGACTCECQWSEHGRFNASCVYDGYVERGPAITNFLRLIATKTIAKSAAPSVETGCAPQQCAVRITNRADAADDGRYRVVLRAFILGVRDVRTNWLNTYHLSGMRNEGRRS